MKKYILTYITIDSLFVASAFAGKQVYDITLF